jgi:hypothetical protein
MGTWGTAIFSDDTASDVRDEFRDLIGEGLSTEQATDKLLREYASSLDDPDDGPPFWLGLAVTQWNCGRLLEQVKEKALHIIDTGADLKRWSGDAKRRAVLEKTRAQLLSAQPRLRRIRKRYQENNDWEVSELISYQTPHGKYAVLRVLGHATGSTGKHPIIELVDWYAATPPSFDDARHLEARFGIERTERGYGLSHAAILAATSSRDQPAARLSRLGLSTAPFERIERCNTFRPWRHFGDYVDKVFAGPKQLLAGLGGDAHQSWRAGDIFCCRTADGKCLLFRMIDRIDVKPFVRDAPIVALLDWNRPTAPAPADILALRPALDHAKLGVHFALTHDDGNAAPEQAFEHIGHSAEVTGKGIRTIASLDMVVWRAERSLRVFTLRRILLELLQNTDGPMTIAAIWNYVRENGGESSTASLAEIDALLNHLSRYAYPFERVGKNSWKWGVGRPAAAWRWEP